MRVDEVVFDPYLRKSTKDEYRSVERQRGDMVEAADAEGLRLGETWYVDPDLPASRFARKERPGYAALVDLIGAGQCRGLAIVEASRGSRTLTQWSGFLDLCRKHRVLIWVVSHGRVYDPTRRHDWRTLADEGVNAADESERLSERILSGKRKAARDGKPAGPLTFGLLRVYDEKGDLVEVVAHPTQAKVRADLVQRVADGDKLAVIAADLNAAGVATVRGGVWSALTVRSVALSPVNVGRRVHHGEDFGPAMWKPLVDQAVWARAVTRLTDPGLRKYTSRGSALACWLSGAIVCGACGTNRLRLKNGQLSCKGCYGVKVAREPVERLVEAAVLARLGRADAGEVFAVDVDTAALSRAKDDLDDLRATMKGHYAQAAMRRLSPEGLAEMEAQLKPQITKAEDRVRALSTPSALATLGGPARIRQEWPHLSPTDRRTVLTTLADVVVMPAQRKGGRGLDPRRLDHSRWHGDTHTWGELLTPDPPTVAA